HLTDIGYTYFNRMDRQKDRKDSRREDDLESKKRRVDKDDDIEGMVKKGVFQEEDEVQILFSGSKDQSKRKDSTEELLKKAKEKYKSLKAQLKESKERESGLSRRVEQFELLSREKGKLRRIFTPNLRKGPKGYLRERASMREKLN
ncbi:hypothetical protein PMAYCL1PPCAC_25909, partial [Pristionchus mayeri]